MKTRWHHEVTLTATLPAVKENSYRHRADHTKWHGVYFLCDGGSSDFGVRAQARLRASATEMFSPSTAGKELPTGGPAFSRSRIRRMECRTAATDSLTFRAPSADVSWVLKNCQGAFSSVLKNGRRALDGFWPNSTTRSPSYDDITIFSDLPAAVLLRWSGGHVRSGVNTIETNRGSGVGGLVKDCG